MENENHKYIEVIQEIRSHVTAYQGKVLDYVLKHQNEFTTYRKISNETGILYNTVKRSILSLSQNVIEQYDICDLSRGQTFKLKLKINRRNRRLQTFAKERGFDPEKDYSVDPSVFNAWTDEDYDEHSVIRLTSQIKNHPELRWWYERGMTIEKIEKWCKEFQINNVNMTHSLRFFVYDMKFNRRMCDSNGELISNFTNYFYQCIKKNNGFYDKPENYKTHREIQEGMYRQHVEKRKEEIKNLRKARIEKEYFDNEFNFQKMINNPESDMYKRCYDDIPEAYKRIVIRMKCKGPYFLDRMREAYAKIHNLEGFTEYNPQKKRDETREKERYVQKIEGYRE